MRYNSEDMNHSDFFAERRIAIGLSQAKVGQLLGYSAQSVAAWESGRSFPDLVVWSKYASILGVDLEGFLFAKNQKKDDMCNTLKFDNEKFSKNLRHLRKKNNLILSDLSKLISVNVKTISAWEKGSSFPNLKVFLKLCELYKYSYNELYFVIEENKSKEAFKPIRKKRIFIPIILPIIIGTSAAGGGVTAAVVATQQQKMLPNNVAPRVENYYTITWQNYDGIVLEIDENVLEGTLPTYDGEVPAKEKDSQYTYTFDGWSPEVVEVSENATYTASFKNSTNSYVVRWKNYDGALLVEESYEYGVIPTYKGEEPTHPSDVAYNYTFEGWSPEIVEVKGDTTYVATFKSNVNKYIVTWQNYDGAVIAKESYEYGATPVYKGETPIKPSDKAYSYTFDSWSPEIKVVDDDATYTATYKSKINKYTVKWKNYDGTLLDEETYEYGQMPTYKGDTPVKPSDAEYTYVFTGWTPELKAVSENVTYVATFSDSTNSYSVKWKNYDGTLLQEETYEYGVTPTYKGDTPTKPSDAEYSYTFSGWTPEIVDVTQNAVYTAVFKSNINKYTVTWKNYDGSLLDEEQYDYGSTPTYKGDTPTKDKDLQYTYTFNGWSPEVTKVTKNATYTASFSSSINSYTVKWENYDGTLLQEETYEYGATPSYKGDTPTKSSDGAYSYAFDGWTPTIEIVEGNQTYKATYKSKAILSYSLVTIAGKQVAEITGCDETTTDLLIPSKIDDYDVRGINESAFINNSVLKTATISEGVTYIEENAFVNCSSLESVTLPTSLETIGQSAFFDCVSLTSINIPDKVTSLFTNTFTNCNSISTESLTLYDNAYYIGSSANPYLQLFRAKNKNITSCTISNDSMCKNIADKAFLECDKITTFEIPENINEIGQNAFYGTSITTLTIPEGFTKLDYCVFYGCPLETIYLPSTLELISHGAFYGTELEAIVMDDNNPYYKSYDGALYYKDMSRLMFYPGNKAGNLYVIPTQTTEIDPYVFPNGYPFTSIVMHANFVISYATLPAVTDIYYLGTTSQWENVTMQDYTGNVHFYSEVEVPDPQGISYWHYVNDVPTLWE